MTNPYQTPEDQPLSESNEVQPRLTRGKVLLTGIFSFLIGMAAIYGTARLALAGIPPKIADGFSAIIYLFAFVCFLFGTLCFVTYHWFPSQRRGYSWRRKDSRPIIGSDEWFDS